MSDRTGLNYAEYQILGDLESPAKLQELGRDGAPSREAVTEVLGPALVSLAEDDLIEVRRFETWPAPWADGVPVSGDELRQASGRVEEWSGDTDHDVLVADVTEAGAAYL
ncbi:hypothetical protein [Actinoplanes sp. HUAS TT8]|uniref:hypothetical protein n=1 Tax=Actinoplanes sp. HUAS TT8 TaxID=3447453 RepID=UPI003F51EDFB